MVAYVYTVQSVFFDRQRNIEKSSHNTGGC